MTIVAGAAVGILGVEGWGGFIVYILSQLLVSKELIGTWQQQQRAYLQLDM